MTAMWPVGYVVAGRKDETYDTVTLMLRPAGDPIQTPRPRWASMPCRSSSSTGPGRLIRPKRHHDCAAA
jgi:hypothetical protein